MRRTRAALAAGCWIALATGCAVRLPHDRATRESPFEPAEASARLYVERTARLLAVSHAIRAAGAPLCGDRIGPILGVAAWRSNPRFGRPFFDALERVYGIDAGTVAVVAVVPDSPADRAGIAVGDQILRVGSREIQSDAALFDRVADFDSGPIPITVLRPTGETTVRVAALTACAPVASLEIGDLMLSDRTGRNHFYVTTGFMRFARTDDELALVVAHEIAHQLDGMQFVTGPQREVLADRLGLYLVARAGYDVSIAPDFWDRVAAEQPWSLSEDEDQYGWTRIPPHGHMASRAVAIRRLVAEIQAKSASGQPLSIDSDP